MSPSFLSLSMHRALWAVAGLSLLIRLVISATFPITGDEAFFLLVGRIPRLGLLRPPPHGGLVHRRHAARTG